MGIGVSWEADVLTAGKEAAEQAITHLGGHPADLILVFSSIRFADPKLLMGIRSVTQNAPLIGCSDAGGIHTAGPKRRCVTVAALVSKGGKFVTGLVRDVAHNPKKAGEQLAELLMKDRPEQPQGVLLFPDGLSLNGMDLLRGLESTLATPVPIVGGAAADDFFFQKSFQYYNDEILSDAVPAVLFCGDIRLGVGVRHGWVPLGRPRRVTRASGRVIYQLDRQPAVTIYEDYLGIKREDLMNEPLAHVAITYPLGTAVEGQSEYLLRDAIRVGREGSLICTGEIPQGTDVRLMIGGYGSALEAAQQAAYDALEQVGRQRLTGALIFSSVARQKVLGSEFHGEIDVIRDALGGAGVRLGGFYTYGEIAPVEDAKGKRRSTIFHNESVVVLGLG